MNIKANDTTLNLAGYNVAVSLAGDGTSESYVKIPSALLVKSNEVIKIRVILIQL